MNRVLAFFALLLAASLPPDAGLAGNGPEAPFADHPMIGEPAPDFALPGIDGKTLGLADLRGRYLVIHFGTSW